MNNNGCIRVTRGGHDRLYMRLLPPDPDAAKAVKDTVDSLLTRELQTLSLRLETPILMADPTYATEAEKRQRKEEEESFKTVESLYDDLPEWA
jgi:hypothetical protein